jgi:hypothetical protein
MIKKLIFITCLFFYISSFSESQISFTQSEDLLYKDIIAENLSFIIMKHFGDEKKAKDDIDAFLLKHELSVQELYNFLSKKEAEFNQSSSKMSQKIESMKYRPKLSNLLLPETGYASVPGTGFLPFFIAGGLWIIGMPPLLLGMNMKSSQNIKTLKKAISWGLITIGGILTIPGNIIGLGMIARIIEDKLLPLDSKEKKRREFFKILDKEQNIKVLMRVLEILYS